MTHTFTSRRTAIRGSTTRGLLGQLAVVLLALVVLWRFGAAGWRKETDSRTVAESPRPSEFTSSIPRTSLDEAPESPAREEGGEAEESSPTTGDDASDSEGSSLLVSLTDGTKPLGPAVLQIAGPEKDPLRTIAVDAQTGQALFEGLKPGRHRITFESLPSGWLAPRLARLGDPASVESVQVQLEPGTNVREIVLERSVRVFGRVLGPDGEPLSEILVRFSSFEANGTRSREPPFDFLVESGEFEGEVHDGIWSAEAFDSVGLATSPASRVVLHSLLPRAECSPPPPQICRLRAGTVEELDFAYERGEGVIEGRIVDETNRPFAGVAVSALRIFAETDPESGVTIRREQRIQESRSSDSGSFSLQDLPPARYRVLVKPRDDLGILPPGASPIGDGRHEAEVTLGADGVARVEITVPRSHPVRVHGTIDVDQEKLGAARLGQQIPSVFLALHPSGPSAPAIRYMLECVGDRFDFYLDSGVRDPSIEIELDGLRASYPFTIAPDSEPAALHFRFPK